MMTLGELSPALAEWLEMLEQRVAALEAREKLRAGSMGHDATDSPPVVLTDAPPDGPR